MKMKTGIRAFPDHVRDFIVECGEWKEKANDIREARKMHMSLLMEAGESPEEAAKAADAKGLVVPPSPYKRLFSFWW